MNFIFHSASLGRVLSLVLVLSLLLCLALPVSAKVSDPGMVPSDQTTVLYDVTEVILPGCVKEGFLFLGWNTSASGTGTHYNVGDVFTLTTDTTLYGEWQDLRVDPIGNSLDAWADAPYDVDVHERVGALEPGFSGNFVGVPDVERLNAEAQSASTSYLHFDSWRVVTGSTDEMVSPSALDTYLRNICTSDTEVVLIAYYQRVETAPSTYSAPAPAAPAPSASNVEEEIVWECDSFPTP